MTSRQAAACRTTSFVISGRWRAPPTRASCGGVVQRTASSERLKQFDALVTWRHVDDVIVQLHQKGENVWQAYARARHTGGVSADHNSVLSELWETGRVLLR